LSETVKIYHNPRCSKSRQALARIRETGREPEIVEYLKKAPGKAELEELAVESGVGVRGLMRTGEQVYKDLGLADEKWSDAQLIGFMVENPILINRPIVVTGKGVRLGRPVEVIDEIL
jgi:arsenate reductase